MSFPSLFDNLKKRRVIRTTLIYAALLWVILQAADLLAGAGIISEQLVRWAILLGAVGLPVTVLASWFLDSPWKQQRWMAVTGDLVIIAAIALAAVLFAWQQWFTSFARPTVAVLKIEATDLRPESEDLAAHLALRLRMTLATRPELRVIELTSSHAEALQGRTVADKASLLGADYLLSGTVAQSESRLRLNLQLFDREGQLVHGESFEDRLADQVQLQNRVMASFWDHLPLPADGRQVVRDMIAGCAYPDERIALLWVFAVDGGRSITSLPDLPENYDAEGIWQLTQARVLFDQLPSVPAPQRPVMQQVAMQRLANAEEQCAGLPDVELLRFGHTLDRSNVEELILRHPSAAGLYRAAAGQNSEPRRATAFIEEARLLDPLGDW